MRRLPRDLPSHLRWNVGDFTEPFEVVWTHKDDTWFTIVNQVKITLWKDDKDEIRANAVVLNRMSNPIGQPVWYSSPIAAFNDCGWEIAK